METCWSSSFYWGFYFCVQQWRTTPDRVQQWRTTPESSAMEDYTRQSSIKSNSEHQGLQGRGSGSPGHLNTFSNLKINANTFSLSTDILPWRRPQDTLDIYFWSNISLNYHLCSKEAGDVRFSRNISIGAFSSFVFCHRLPFWKPIQGESAVTHIWRENKLSFKKSSFPSHTFSHQLMFSFFLHTQISCSRWIYQAFFETLTFKF